MERRISVLMTVDEQYVTPLTVTVSSLLEHLRPGVALDLYLVAPGLTSETRGKLESVWHDRVRLHWVPLDRTKLARFRGYGARLSSAANFRVLLGSSLPDDVSKVIYLDADLLIRKDIFELWQHDMKGCIALAVEDSYIQSFPLFCLRCLPAGKGADPERRYFNSGVMVIDVDAWRAAAIEQCCFQTARRLKHRTRWVDQDILNICLAGCWGSLPPVWNKQFSLNLYPDWQCSPYNEPEFEEALKRPAIIHFCTQTKPWHPFCDHPLEDVLAYRAVLGNIAFAGGGTLRPSLLRRTLERFAAPHRRLLDTLAAAVRAKRRKHALQAMLPHMLKLAALYPWTLLSVPLSVFRERIAMRLRGTAQ